MAAALALAPAAGASQLVDRDAREVELQVDREGRALVSYTKDGRRRHVLAWGAINALPPSRARRQVEFELDYSGGWGAFGKPLWKAFADICGPYEGPPLPWLVTACTAPDGTHWALQTWQRALPNYGLQPTGAQDAWELRLSHFDGEPARFTVRVNWAYRRFDHLFGSLTYRGVPVHGFRATPSGVPLDSYGRNVYLDTFDSAYGPGWKRENSFLLHRGSGVFCYGLYRHGDRPSGAGKRYRATVIGPGVTPDVRWQGAAPGPYDAERDRELAAAQRELYGADQACKPV